MWGDPEGEPGRREPGCPLACPWPAQPFPEDRATEKAPGDTQARCPISEGGTGGSVAG